MRSLIAMATSALLASGVPSFSAEEGKAISCRFADAVYELVEPSGSGSKARLEFRPADTVSGLAGAMTIGKGSSIDFDIVFNNGASRYWATMDLGDEHVISPHIQTFNAGMTLGTMVPDEPAPEFVVFPLAAYEAYQAQFNRPIEDSIYPIEEPWRLSDCRE